MGIGHGSALPDVVDWQTIKALADKQGVTAIVVDGIEKLPDTKRPPKELLLQWIGEVFHSYENRYKLYQRAIAELAGWYNARGYKMMVLKGYACSMDWPKPEHRPCGDIDIWLFGRQKEADALLASEKSILVDYSHHHHTVFDWNGFMVENHYDFLDINIRKSSRKFEAVLKDLGTDDSYYISLLRERVYIPSPNLHALFLIRHMVDHFTSVSINLRQILDWAFFVNKYTNDIDWDRLNSFLEDNHLKEFSDCLNAICIEDLGFKAELFRYNQYEPLLKESILDDILNPKFEAVAPMQLMSRLTYKYKRWQGNAWKQRLCYPESRFISFFTSLRAHLIKPASI